MLNLSDMGDLVQPFASRASPSSGELDGGIDGATIWLACECGAGIARRADERDALDVTG